MIVFEEFALLRPLWLVGLLAAPIAIWLAVRRAGGLGGWDAVVDPQIMSAMKALGRVVPGRARLGAAPAIIAAICALALSGPAREARDAATYRNLDGLVIVLDISLSVAEAGYQDAALTAARQVSDGAGSRPVSLVVFGGEAYLASTFTTDRKLLGTVIASLRSLEPLDPGSRPGQGLSLARKTLSQAGLIAGEVILISDGGGSGPDVIAAAAQLADTGAVLNVIALNPDRAARLEVLADAGGGEIRSAVDLEAVGRPFGGGAAGRVAASDYAVLLWRDHGRYLLVLALIPALTLFRRAV